MGDRRTAGFRRLSQLLSPLCRHLLLLTRHTIPLDDRQLGDVRLCARRMVSVLRIPIKLRILKWHRHDKAIPKVYSPIVVRGLYHTSGTDNLLRIDRNEIKSVESKAHTIDHSIRICIRSNSTISIKLDSSSNFDNAKPFSKIPGPRGLPYLGTLFQYRKGNTWEVKVGLTSSSLPQVILEKLKSEDDLLVVLSGGATDEIPKEQPTMSNLRVAASILEANSDVNGPFQKFNIDRLQDALTARCREYGPIMKEKIAGVTVVHLFDPDFVRIVFQHEGKIPHIAPLMETAQCYRKQRNMSPGLGNSNGQEWYRLRSAVQQMMRPKAVTAYLSMVNEVASDFVDRISRIRDENGEVPNFKNEIAKWNLESSGMTFFEKRLGCIDAEHDSLPQKIINANSEIFRLSTGLKFSVPWFKLFPTPTWKKFTKAKDLFFGNGQKIFDECVSKINHISEKGELTEDKYIFLTYLLSRPELSFKEISVLIISLFGDGLNATTPTLMWNLYCLAKNQNVQEKVYEEVCRVVPKNQPVTAEMINKLVYLKAFIKETFRFYPVGLDIARIPQENLVIGGYQVPAGTHIEMNNFVLFQSPDYFSEPEKFLPERWLRGGDAHDINPFILIPFGHGPRMCVGRRFAEQEIYVVLSKILQQFRLDWHHEDMNQMFQMLMVPDKPATFTFVQRNGHRDIHTVKI